jgi:hypothetical protein
VAAVPVGDGVNLLDWGDSDSDTDAPRPLSFDAPATAATATATTTAISTSAVPTTVPSSSSSSSLVLKKRVELTPQRFQELWMSLPDIRIDGHGHIGSLPGGDATTIAVVEEAVRARHVHVMASGPSADPAGMKLFVYAQEADRADPHDFLLGGAEGRLLLAQLVLNLDAGTVTLTLKTPAGASADAGADAAESATSAAALGQVFAGLILQALAPLGIVAPT